MKNELFGMVTFSLSLQEDAISDISRLLRCILIKCKRKLLKVRVTLVVVVCSNGWLMNVDAVMLRTGTMPLKLVFPRSGYPANHPTTIIIVLVFVTLDMLHCSEEQGGLL